MSSGLAFGAISRAAPRIDAAEFRIAEQEDRERIEREFERAGRKTKSGGGFGSLLGTIAGAATLAIPGVNLLGAAMLAGVGSGVGRKVGAEAGLKASGIDSFKPRFHRKEVKRGVRDIKSSIDQQALSTAVTTALTVYQLGKAAPGLEGFMKNIAAGKETSFAQLFNDPATIAKKHPGIANMPKLTKFAMPQNALQDPLFLSDDDFFGSGRF